MHIYCHSSLLLSLLSAAGAGKGVIFNGDCVPVSLLNVRFRYYGYVHSFRFQVVLDGQLFVCHATDIESHDSRLFTHCFFRSVRVVSPFLFLVRSGSPSIFLCCVVKSGPLICLLLNVLFACIYFFFEFWYFCCFVDDLTWSLLCLLLRRYHHPMSACSIFLVVCSFFCGLLFVLLMAAVSCCLL